MRPIHPAGRSLLALFALFSAPAFADGHDHSAPDYLIYPDTFATTFASPTPTSVLDSLLVHIPAGAVVPKADVYILADTTGSMGSVIGAVRTNAASLVSSLYATSGVDVQIGIGNYKDFPSDAYAFDHQLDPAGSTSAASVTAAINTWSASGGNDIAEGQFFALDRLAYDIDPAGGDIGWRSDAKKIIVWFGDAPAHDKICQAMTNAKGFSIGYDITENTVTNALVNGQFTVVAISNTTGVSSALNANPSVYSSDYNTLCGASTGTANQATRITSATGGTHLAGVGSSTINSSILSLVASAVGTINEVTLVASANIADYVTDIARPLEANCFNVSTAAGEDCFFDVTLEGECGNADETLIGTLGAYVDGAWVADQTVTLTIESCNEPPVALCEDRVVAADANCSACDSVDAGSYDPDGDDDIFSIEEYPTCDYGLGSNTVTLTITDLAGEYDTCSAEVLVVDTTGPTISTSTAQMWPPNHKYQSFTLSDCAAVPADNCDGTALDIDVVGTITRITSDEVENATGNGDGNTTADAVITGSSSFDLRAERQGGGNGRVYTVYFSAADTSGNESEGACTITVPHDQRGSSAVDSGAAYTVTP